MRKWVADACCSFFLWGLFFRAEAVLPAIRQSLALCLDTLTPSLFPFLVVSLFLSGCGAGELFSFLMTPITKWVLRLPNELGQTVLFSLIGGYPTGARLLSSLVEEKSLSREDSAVLLGFCVSPGPAFVVLAVGQQMFGSQTLGVLLLVSQLTASLLLGAILCRRKHISLLSQKGSALPLTKALVRAVSQASSGMLTICAYVVLCAAVSSLLPQTGFFSVLASLLEVTTGCVRASAISGIGGVLLASFLLAFGGISVCMQVIAIAAEGGIPIRRFFLSRICCGMLSAGITAALMRIFSDAISTMASVGEPVPLTTPNRMLGALCLCGMIFVTLTDFSTRHTVDF